MLPLADTAKQKGPAAVTQLLIAANVVVFGWQAWRLVSGGEGALNAMVATHALIPQRLTRHLADPAAWLPMLTHMFMHGGVLHLLGNVWFLWVFGANVEGRLGPVRYLLFYVLVGLAAAASQVATAPFSEVPMVGASGAISGVMGAYLVLFPTAFVWTLVPSLVPILPIPALIFLVLWFVLQAYNGFGALFSGASAGGGVAWWAHAGGFAAGFALTLYAKRAKWIRGR